MAVWFVILGEAMTKIDRVHMAQTDRGARDALFGRLFADYQEPILNYLYRLLGSTREAEDVCQDVFVRAYAALDRLPVTANQRAWLYRIATNAAIDVQRRRALVRWVRLGREDSGDAGVDTGADGGPDARVPEAMAVQRTLERLPIKYRQVLVLFTIQGYSIREISEMVGVSEGAVKVRLYRARERFRHLYGEDSQNAV